MKNNYTLDPSRVIQIDYTNWEGKRAIRSIRPKYIYFGSTQKHPKKQWILKAYDVDKEDWRRFPLENIHGWVGDNNEEKEEEIRTSI